MLGIGLGLNLSIGTKVGGSSPPSAVPLASDSFNRGNNVDLGSTDGAGSIIPGGAGKIWTKTAGGWEISSNQLLNVSGGANNLVTIDIAEPEITIECDHSAPGLNVTGPAIVVRVVDNNNYWRVLRFSSIMYIYEVIAGVDNVRIQTAPIPALEVDTHTFVSIEGEMLTAIAAATVLQWDMSGGHSTGTKVGFWSNSGFAASFDNFQVWKLNEYPF